MPRDTDGNYTLPTPENPVVTGTVITASDFNTTMDDIAAELTDSWSRSGKGGLQSPVLLADGTQAAPSLAFTNETGTGWYRSAAGVMRAAILGTWRLLLGAAGIQVNGNITATGTLGVSGNATLSSDVIADSYKSAVPDAAAAVGFSLDTNAAYTTSGAKLFSLLNNGVEKFAIDKDGTVTVGTIGTGTQTPVNSVASTPVTVELTGTNLAWADVGTLSVEFTSTGRPVIFYLLHDTVGTASQGYIKNINADTDSQTVGFRIYNGTASIGDTGLLASAGAEASLPVPLMVGFCIPTAGTATYTLQMISSTANTTWAINRVMLYAVEL